MSIWKEAGDLISRKNRIGKESFISKGSTKEKLESVYLNVSFYLDFLGKFCLDISC
jgi:hypothetical protein